MINQFNYNSLLVVARQGRHATNSSGTPLAINSSSKAARETIVLVVVSASADDDDSAVVAPSS